MNGNIVLKGLTLASEYAVPGIIIFIIVFGVIKKVKVYEEFVQGAKEGFNVAVMIIPYLVAILVAIGMLRDTLALDAFSKIASPLTSLIGMPAELLPLTLLRSLSGGGTMGYMAAIFEDYGPDSFNGQLASVLVGSTETTFYILAVYFGSVSIQKTRHAVIVGVLADIASALAAVWLCLAFKDYLMGGG